MKIYTSMDYFFCKIQKTLFLGCFWALSLKWDCFQKIWSQFITLTAPKLHEKFQKNPISCLEKHVYLLTYWQWWNHRTPFCLKTGVEKTIGCVKKPTRFILDPYCVWYLYALDGMPLFTFCGNFHTPKTWYLHAVKGDFIFKLL